MKTFNRFTAALLTLAMILSFTLIFADASSTGIKTKIDKLLEVYPDGSYFTSDGGPSGGSSTDKCNIENIPSRVVPSTGEMLPDGKTVSMCDYQGWSYSCRAFANYVWYYLFGCHYSNGKNHKVDLGGGEAPAYGDFLIFNYGSHTAIYLWEDDDYYYVYDANGEGTSNCQVLFNHRFSKAKWTLTGCYHPYNYESAYSNVATAYTRPNTSQYYIKNLRTGHSITRGLVLTDELITRPDEVTLEQRWVGFTIVTSDNWRNMLSLNADKQTTTADATLVIRENSLWQLVDAGVGYFIHNKMYPEIVLADVNGKLMAVTYTGAANQLWSIDHTEHKYTAKIITQATCTTYGEALYTCACGDSYTDRTAPSGHVLTNTVTVQATAASCGFKKGKCSTCGEIIREITAGRLKTDVPVSTATVRTDGGTVFVSAKVTDEQFADLFPEFYASIGDNMKATGSEITSDRYAQSFFVVLLGDADGNGTSDVGDARFILRAAIGLEQAAGFTKAASDWDADGKITVSDAREQLRFAIGLTGCDKFFSTMKLTW